ncbi:MAG: O-antigen ligase family protein [Saprospirales bacterium]|nr:O-antigen ligase family protein [Saprospirales bacterium]MBK8491698.1 O-antigen ligase family protein [Saprospirales bacterium]
MKLFLQSYKALSISLFMIWMVAMVFSAEFILSQVMILFVAMALFEYRPGFPWLRWRRELRDNTRTWWWYRPFLFVAIPFLLVLVSAAWSSDIPYTLERLRIKAPFLVLPWALVGIPRISRKEFHFILYFLLALMTIACLYVGLNYLVHFQEINDMIGRGKPIPTPSNHIRFSLVLCFAILSGFFLIAERFFIRYRWERWLILGLTMFLLGFIHLLSVRSGLLVLYLAVLVWLLRYVFLTRRWAVAVALGVSFVFLPIVAYQLFPSFRTKLEYVRWDLVQHQHGTGANYSDSDRLTSLKVGWEIGKRNPIFGVGAGDLKREVNLEYARSFPDAPTIKMPHNQYVTLFAGTGLVGVGVFTLGFFYPLFYRRHYKDPLFLALHVVVFASFLMENTLENNFGISFFLLFLLLGLNRLRPDPTRIPPPPG